MGPDQAVYLGIRALQKLEENVRAQIAGGAGQKNMLLRIERQLVGRLPEPGRMLNQIPDRLIGPICLFSCRLLTLQVGNAGRQLLHSGILEEIVDF
ncbi:hypothetical protein D3C73_1450800 [compost metagenome]